MPGLVTPLSERSLGWLVRTAAVIDDKPWELTSERRSEVEGARAELLGRVGHQRSERLIALTRDAQAGRDSPATADTIEHALALAAVSLNKTDDGRLDDDALAGYGRFNALATRRLRRLAEGAEADFTAAVNAGLSNYSTERWEYKDQTATGGHGWRRAGVDRGAETPYSFEALAALLPALIKQAAAERAVNARRWADMQTEEARRAEAATARATQRLAAAKEAARQAQAAARQAQAAAG